MFKRRKTDKNCGSLFAIGNILIPLIAGGLFYVFFRPESYISVFIISLTGKSEELRTGLQSINSYLPLFFRNYLCDMLWAYALTFSCYLAAARKEKDLIKIVIFVFLFETMLELIQLSPKFPGIFDPVDMILEYTATAIGVVMLLLWKNKKERK